MFCALTIRQRLRDLGLVRMFTPVATLTRALVIAAGPATREPRTRIDPLCHRHSGPLRTRFLDAAGVGEGAAAAPSATDPTTPR